MSKDTIYRQAAIDAVNELTYPSSLVDVKRKLVQLPSADRPRGEWIDNGDRYYRCSLCGTRDTDTWDWCHGCGCRMIREDDEA